MSANVSPYRILTETINIATGYSLMQFITLQPYQVMAEVRFLAGATGYVCGATLNSSSGATPFFPWVAGVTQGIMIPATAQGGVPVSIPGPVPFYIGAGGATTTVEITRYYSAGK